MCKTKIEKIIKVARNYNTKYNEVMGSDNFKNIIPFAMGGLGLVAGATFKSLFLFLFSLIIILWGIYTYIQPLLYKHLLLQKVIRIIFISCYPIYIFFNGIIFCELYFSEITDAYSIFLIVFSIIGSSLVVGSLTLKDAIKHIRKINEKKSYVFYLLLEFYQIINFFAVLYSLVLVFDHNGIAGINTRNAFTIYFDMVYFSTITFTTLGYGDIIPINPYAKAIVISEVFLFVIVISIIVVNLSKDKQAMEESSDVEVTDKQKC